MLYLPALHVTSLPFTILIKIKEFINKFAEILSQ